MQSYSEAPAPMRAIADGRTVYHAGEPFAMIPERIILNPTLGPEPKALFTIVAMLIYRGRGECRATIDELALYFGRKKSSVRQHLDVLVRRGYITRERSGFGDGNVYRFADSTPGNLSIQPPIQPPIEPEFRLNDDAPFSRPFSRPDDHHSAAQTAEYSLPEKLKRKEPETTFPEGVQGKPKRTTEHVAYADLSTGARAVVDDWRAKQGRKKPPALNPTLAAKLEAAVADVGVARLQESNTWAAENEVPQLVKAIRAAYTKRQTDERGPDRPTESRYARTATPSRASASYSPPTSAPVNVRTY